MGVRRAVNLVLKALNEKCSPLYTYGPLIHNPQTLELLNMLGVKTLKTLDEALDENLPSGVLVIRAHGVPPQEKEALSKKHKILDGTCPRVAKVQFLAQKAALKGKNVVIIGDKDHAEVRGILGYCQNRGYVISDEKEVETLPPLKNYVILSQTTQDEKLFKRISEEILGLHEGGEVINTICNATEVRQNEVRNLCRDCAGIVVIGGKFSANTKRLAEIAKNEGKEVFLIEKPEELPIKRLKELGHIGITAGASTPNWLINEIMDRLKTNSSTLYQSLKILTFTSVPLALTLTLILAGFLNLIKHPLNLSYFYLLGFCLFFHLMKYNLKTYLEKESYRFYFPIKFHFLADHKTLIKSLAVFSGILALIFALLYNPKILTLGLALIILFFLVSKTYLSFFIEPLFLTGISLYLFPLWKLEFALSFIFTILIFIYIKIYLEMVYLQTDGFLPKSFIILNFTDSYKSAFTILKLLLLLKIIVLAILCYINFIHILLFCIILFCYFTKLLLQKRPLGQIIYMEFLPIFLSLSFFMTTLLINLH